MSEYLTHPNHEKIESKLGALFNELVPMYGNCKTVAGEIVRAINRVIYRFYSDGDIAGEGYGKETVNPAVRYLNAMYHQYIDKNHDLPTHYCFLEHWGTDKGYDFTIYEDAQTFLTFIEEHPELKTIPNTENYLDWATDDDQDDW